METAMCLAIPAKITELTGQQAKVELSGNVIDADVSLVEKATVGDWVLVHAGFAIEKLEPEDAAETLKLFDELEECRKADDGS
jgi:hydrogenase expression/formation protein HypC